MVRLLFDLFVLIFSVFLSLSFYFRAWTRIGRDKLTIRNSKSKVIGVNVI